MIHLKFISKIVRLDDFMVRFDDKPMMEIYDEQLM